MSKKSTLENSDDDSARIKEATQDATSMDISDATLPDISNSGVSIDIKPTRGQFGAAITLRHGDSVIACETVNIGKPADRKRFIENVAKRVSDWHPNNFQSLMDRIDVSLTNYAADVADRLAVNREEPTPLDDDGGWPTPEPTGDIEIDLSRIVRPEAIIRRDVSAYAMPIQFKSGETVRGQWIWYLRNHADGTRQRQRVAGTLLPPDGQQLIVSPQVPLPETTNSPRWSQKSRDAWLKGMPAPELTSVFMNMVDEINRYLYLAGTQQTALLLGLWVVLTYTFRAWSAVPYLFVGGPLGSGKSRVFDILRELVFTPIAASNMTASVLFRTVHERGGTLILDEAERLRDNRSPDVMEVTSILLAGYRQGGVALRCESHGDQFVTREFEVFGPKALACIAGLPPALASRAIKINMLRAPAGEACTMRRLDESADRFQQLRDDLYVVGLENGPTWLELAKRTKVAEGFRGRDFELWQPLLAIAALLDERGMTGVLSAMTDHARTLIAGTEDDTRAEPDELLLQLLYAETRDGQGITATALLAKAQERDPVTFRTWTPRGIGTRLKNYGLNGPVKNNSVKVWRDQEEAVWQRIRDGYGIDLGSA